MVAKHKPDDLKKAKVIGFSCAGFSQEQIADYLGIDTHTLRKHYRYELDHAKLEKLSNISNLVYVQATEGDKWAQEFVLRTQGRWANAKPSEETNTKTETLLEKILEKIK